MFIRKHCLTIVWLSALLTSYPLSAGTYTPGFDARQAHQQQRIEHGSANGSLTPGEVRRLETQQQRIQHASNLARLDGRVSQNERFHLRQQQNRANRLIRHKKHNRFH